MLHINKKICIVLSLCLMVLSLTSCIMEINPGSSGSTTISESLLGKWSSGIIYRTSDALYDYASRTLLTVSGNGTLTVDVEYFLKARTSEKWTTDMSRKPTSTKYVVYDYVYYGYEGRITVCDSNTWETLARFNYSVSEDLRVLTLIDDSGTQEISTKYTRVSDTSVKPDTPKNSK